MRIALSLLLILGLAGSAAAAAPAKKTPAPKPSQATNAVAFAGPTLGNGELKTNQCQSGSRRSFLGVDAYDQNTKEVLVLRLVIDPIEGPVVRLYKDSDSGPSLVLRKSDCSTFDYTLESTGSIVNFVSEMKFGIRLDCRGPKGDQVVGNVDLPACL
ncbi:MAG TPA: hypothetical protein VH394_00765 [Thermoanaerobaculia bacterium]|jgi:hypothetical protein|nr:hypothetical protein [Thermoanaerobaculia bacterium]